jgi:tetratricopeptide (TPR) repeat protein
MELDTYYNLILDYDLLGIKEKRREASERALPYYERYITHNPDDQNKRQKYASLLYFVGRKEDCFRELESLLRLPTLDAKTYFNCACRYAVDGQVDRAFELLAKAFDAGYEDYEQIRTDPDLANLRPTEQWRWLLNFIEDRQKVRTIKIGATS